MHTHTHHSPRMQVYTHAHIHTPTHHSPPMQVPGGVLTSHVCTAHTDTHHRAGTWQRACSLASCGTSTPSVYRTTRQSSARPKHGTSRMWRGRHSATSQTGRTGLTSRPATEPLSWYPTKTTSWCPTKTTTTSQTRRARKVFFFCVRCVIFSVRRHPWLCASRWAPARKGWAAGLRVAMLRPQRSGGGRVRVVGYHPLGSPRVQLPRRRLCKCATAHAHVPPARYSHAGWQAGSLTESGL